MTKKSTRKFELSGDEADLKAFDEILDRLQVLFALPSKGGVILASAGFLDLIADHMYKHGFPLGFNNEAGDEFIRVKFPLLDNLITIARERSQFPDDSEPSPSP